MIMTIKGATRPADDDESLPEDEDGSPQQPPRRQPERDGNGQNPADEEQEDEDDEDEDEDDEDDEDDRDLLQPPISE